MTQELAVNHLAHLFARTRSQHGFRPATRVRRDGEWVLHTYAELGRRVDAIARCLVDPGFVTDDGLCRDDRISIFAHNCPEWLELDLAALTVGAIPVPIFPTSTPEQIVHIISDAQVRVLAVADKSLAQRALSVADRMPSLERIIVLDGDLPDDPAIATISFADLVAGGGLDDSGALTSDGSRWPAVASDAQPSQTARVAGQPRKGQSEPGDDRLRDERSEGSSSSDRPSAAQASTDQSAGPVRDAQQDHRAQLDAIVAERMAQARPDDVAALIYTSGTTGSPKGVMLTHEGVLSEIASLDAFFDFQPTDHSLCFLPLSHAYEWGWSMTLISHGCLNTFVTNPKTVGSMLAEVRPTLFVSVPKLYEQVMTVAQEKVSDSPAKKRIFDWSLQVGKQWWDVGEAGGTPGRILKVQHKLADALVLHSIRDAVGGPKKVLAAGGAPLRKEVEEFFAACGILVSQGYGLTEASPLVSFNCPAAHKFGTAGRPIHGSRIRIADDGEVQYWGKNVMKGYWNQPEATEAAFDDGWLRTGDVGRLDEDGYLLITDRLKDIIVTLNGKNVAPQPIEAELLKDPLFEQAVILGDNRPCLTLLVKPSLPQVEQLAERLHITSLSANEKLRSPELAEEIRRRVAELSAKLPHQEQIRDLSVLWDEFTTDNGLLTPTLKVRRREVEKRFAELIEEMYSKIAIRRKGGAGKDARRNGRVHKDGGSSVRH